MDKSLIAALLLFPLVALGQTHTFPGNNVFPSTSTTDFASGSTVDFTGATVTGLPAGGSVTWGTITGTLSSQTDLNTALTGKQTADSDLTTWAGLTPSANFQTMVPHTFAQMKTDLGLVVGTDVQAFDSDLSSIAALTTTSFGRAFLTQADAAASRTYIGAGTSSFDGVFASLTSKPTTFFGYSISDSSASLRTTITDENGTGAALFSGATTPDFTTGFTIGTAAATGKILIGDGTKFAASTPTWPTSAGTSGYDVVSDGTNFASYPKLVTNSSTSNQALTTADVYLPGSSVVVAAGDFKAKGQYRCVFDITKSAGTGAIIITLRIGTAGTTSDAVIQTYTFNAGTGVADNGTFEVIATFRTVGSGTSAVVQSICRAQHNLANTGLMANTVSTTTLIGSPNPSSGFNSSTATTIGVSFNGQTSFAGSNTMLQAQLIQ